MGKLTIVAVLVCALFAVGSASGNLLLNPGFEDGEWTNEGDLPENYWKWVEGNSWATWKSEDGQQGGNNFQEARTGDKCIAVGSHEEGGFGSFGQSIPVIEGVGYTFGAWVNAESWGDNPNGALIIGWRDNTKKDEWG